MEDDIPVKRSPVYAEFFAKMSKENKLIASIIQNERKSNKLDKVRACKLDISLVDFYLTIEPEHKGFLLRKKFLTVRLEWVTMLVDRGTTHMVMKHKWQAGVPRHPLAVALVDAHDKYVAYDKQQKNVE
jgi:hypothetical protein